MRVVSIVAILAIGTLTGCAVTFDEVNSVDTARYNELRDDTWIDADTVSLGRPMYGSNHLYFPTGAGAQRSAPGTIEEVAQAELAAASKEGWEPVYGRCPFDAALLEDPAKVDAIIGEATEVVDPATGVFVLTRQVVDGATATAAITLTPVSSPVPSSPLSIDVVVMAQVPHHASVATAPPPLVNLDLLGCLGGAGDQPVIGDSETFSPKVWA